MAAAAAATTVTVSGTAQSNITSAITTACNGTAAGTVVFPSGTYSVNSAIVIPGNCTMQAATRGGATLGANQNQIFEIVGDNVTIDGLIFNGGWVSFGGANSYSNFVFTNNTIENLWSGGSSSSPTGLSGPGLINSNISNNTFFNLWGGGSPGFPNPAPSDSSGCPGQDCWGSSAITFSGLDQTTISNNTFNEIATDGMHIDWEAFTGNTGTRSTSGNVIAYNTFTNIRRIPMEIQSQPSGQCPGGCNYNVTPTSGLQIKGNYAHDYALPYYDTWGGSFVPDGVVNPLYINNTFIANPGNQNGYASCMESSSRNGVTQGNVCMSVPGAPKYFGGGIAQGGGSNSSFTSTYQNNIFCGNPNSIGLVQEGSSTYASTVVWQYNYTDGSNCPGGANLTGSNINAAFTSADNQSFPSGGNGTWSLYVVSNLSIKYVQFFLDGATTPLATQEIQDLNTNFANDRKWLYHTTINTSNLTNGSHSVAATATDVSGAVQTITQNFTVGGGVSTPPAGSPTAAASPTSLSFGAISVGQSSPAQAVTLSNGGTAALSIGGIAIAGANAGDFSQSSQCGTTVAAGNSCSIQVTFSPTAAGTRAANLAVSDNAPGSPQNIPLGGTGNAPASNPTLPPGSLPTNLPSGMILWLANNAGVVANNSKVSAWNDQSGAGNNAVQTNPANQPTVVAGSNGQSALRFDGSSSFLSVPSIPIAGDTGLTVMLVSSSATNPQIGYGLYAFLLWPETAYWGGTFFGTYQSSSHFRFGTTQAGNEDSYAMPFNRTNSFGLSEWMHTGTTDFMWFNTQSVATFPGKLAALGGIGPTLLLGQGLNNTFYSGDVEELIVYNRSLSSAERQAVEQYLMTKYHL